MNKPRKSKATKECTGDPTRKGACKFVQQHAAQIVEDQKKSDSQSGHSVNDKNVVYSELFRNNLRTSIEHFYKCGKSSGDKKHSDKPFAYVNMSQATRLKCFEMICPASSRPSTTLQNECPSFTAADK